LIALNIGCGKNVIPGYSGVDSIDFGQEYVINVLNGLPFEDNTVDSIISSHFIEHLDGEERIIFFNEIYRVLKKDAYATIVVPHFSHPCAYGDPTHKFPPISEWYTYYLNKEWRAKYAPHTQYKCNFDATNKIEMVTVDGHEILNLISVIMKLP